MIPSQFRFRLRLTQDFPQGFHKLHGKMLSILWKKPRVQEKKGNVVVGKSVQNLSTQRNLIKRRCRRILTIWLQQQAEPIDLVCIVHRPINRATYDQIQQEFSSLAHRIGNQYR